MHDENRRKLLKGGGSALAVGVVASLGFSARTLAAERLHHPAKGVPAVVIEANKVGICATCRFWGGRRRVSEDKQAVYSESLGWCNNPDSYHYQAMTTPETGPMKSWLKWEAL